VLAPVDRVVAELQATDVKHLGDDPVVIEFVCGTAKIQVAAKAEHRALAMGPWTTPATSAAPATAVDQGSRDSRFEFGGVPLHTRG